MNKPAINVTPLIDVLLVLLIIFMVVSPLKPSAFRSKVPRESQTQIYPDPNTLLVNIGSDLSLKLNNESGLGSVGDSSPLTSGLEQVFEQRKAHLDGSENTKPEKGFDSPDGIERTVFIKARKGMSYGTVVKVIDAVKLAGAAPVSLQIDGIE